MAGDVPLAVVTSTSTVAPAASAGATASICESELTRKFKAGVPPKVTAVAPAKFVPEMTTFVPPVELPATALSPVTAGAAT